MSVRMRAGTERPRPLVWLSPTTLKVARLNTSTRGFAARDCGVGPPAPGRVTAPALAGARLTAADNAANAAIRANFTGILTIGYKPPTTVRRVRRDTPMP